METKSCTQCKQTKELSEYHKKAGTYDGLCSACKVCIRKRLKRDYHGNKECHRDRHRKWQRAHREHVRAYQNEYRTKHREKERARLRRHYACNKGYYVNKTANRKAVKEGARCSCCSNADIRRIYNSAKPGYHVDHIKPLSKGGTHCVRNMQVIPAELNLKKGIKEIIYL